MDELMTKIKTALKKAGMSEELAKYITTKEESKIDEQVKELKESLKLSPEQFLDAIKEAGLGANLDKYLQSETDRRVTEAVKTHDAKLKTETDKKKEEIENAEKKKKENEGLTDEQKLITSLTDEVRELKESFTKILEDRKQSDIQIQIKDALKKADLPEGFVKYIKTNESDKIGEEIENLKNEVLTFQQKEIDKMIKDGTMPAKGTTAETVGEEIATKFAEEKNEGSAEAPFEGKEISGITKTKEQ